MQFWMTSEYIPHLKANKIPEDIYGPDVSITVIIDRFRHGTFNDVLGCSIDGVHSDLGAVNGQEPIKEANKLFYWMVNTVFISFHNFRLTLKELHQIVSESKRDIIQSEVLRKQSFFHLPDKDRHAIQRDLCRDRLMQEGLPPELIKPLKAEAADHERRRAMAIVGGLWLQRKASIAAKKAADDEMEWTPTMTS
jgi:hypothetical protein